MTAGATRTDTFEPFPEILSPGNHGNHIVQFYEDDAYLAKTVADFVVAGLAVGQPAIVVAIPQHRDLITDRLSGLGVDIGRTRGDGSLTMLDAREMLDQLMVDGTPDRERFHQTMSPVLRTSRREGVGVRAYGEIVDLLWNDGNALGAVRLEELWNDLAADHEFSLLCAYAMSNFRKASDGVVFQAICRQHSHVRPTERYSDTTDALRLIEISLLQQRASSLEHEVEQREELEERLRATVSSLHAREVEREQLLNAERVARADAERARAVAEQANRAKSEFLAVMSHELRTPLNAIGGYAELMQLGVHGAVTSGQAEALERIQRSQRHLLGLINEVLNYARLETGNVRYNLVDVSVDDVLRTADALVMPQMRAKHLQYTYEGCEQNLTVRADSEKFQQIVLNLLTNAIKFTSAGGHIHVDSERAGSVAKIKIRDTGIGIPEEKLELIFDPFVQVDSNFTRTREGVGLGLAISRDLARGMGGELTAESVFGEGTTMVLTLPTRKVSS
jgi:signal transduction histidine kinase